MDYWHALEVYKDMVLLYMEEGQRWVNSHCAHLEPWQIIGATVFITLGAVWVKSFLFQQESLTSRIKKQWVRLIRKIPFVGVAGAVYGMAQSIPDRSIVTEAAWSYLDCLYSTEVKTNTSHMKAH
uniref:sphingosine-1-phosphate lyase 1-like n=1 Tax=Monopterus albus TaxID=43700 RepID=UPI0009B475AA|nr:sphingosine-1-phosphate lyase 1-like [Monopterus albus]